MRVHLEQNHNGGSCAPRAQLRCPRCAELEEENAELRKQLAWEVDQLAVQRLRKVLGTNPAETTVLMALYHAQPRVVTKAAIDGLLPVSCRGDSDKLPAVYVCRIRKKLPAGCIEGIWGQGYRLTAPGVEAVRKALS